MDPVRLRTALEQLQRATHDHAEWQENLLRAVVRGLPPDPNDCREGARVTCHFDRWYYERVPVELWGQPAFAALGMERSDLFRFLDERTTLHGRVEFGDELEIAGYYIEHRSLRSLDNGPGGRTVVDPRYSDIFDDLYWNEALR